MAWRRGCEELEDDVLGRDIFCAEGSGYRAGDSGRCRIVQPSDDFIRRSNNQLKGKRLCLWSSSDVDHAQQNMAGTHSSYRGGSIIGSYKLRCPC
jgi:hypothetical protein